MPHVGWRDQKLSVKSAPHATFQTQLELRLTPALLLELHGHLDAALAVGGAELRLDLPDGWTIYWKRREQGLSRLQLARPQEKQWVASVQLSSEHGLAFLSALQTAAAHQAAAASSPTTISLASLGALTHIVNFELLIVVS